MDNFITSSVLRSKMSVCKPKKERVLRPVVDVAKCSSLVLHQKRHLTALEFEYLKQDSEPNDFEKRIRRNFGKLHWMAKAAC